ncbi:MAG: FecCD family ABC transporter permease [Bacteroidota bacterium]
MNKINPIRDKLLFLALVGGVFLVFLASISWGSTPIPLEQILRILGGAEIENAAVQTIVLDIRMPRAIAALIGGAALGVSGLLLQILFRNPVVDSFVLGISSGSGLAVGLVILAGITFGMGSNLPYLVILAALGGALLVMVLVLSLARRFPDLASLLVVGLFFGYLCSAANSFLMAFSQREQLQSYLNWSFGSFSGFTWPQVGILSMIALPAFGYSFLLSKPLNALLLGEDYARSIGVEHLGLRRRIVWVTSILSAIVTAYAGPVAFVGLAVPHLGRLVFKTADNRVLIPAILLLGAIITGVCDLGARTLMSPIELPLTSVTSLFGAPLVIYLVMRRKGRQ